MSIPILNYFIKSTPLKDDSYDHELYIVAPFNGTAQEVNVDLVEYNNEGKGIILVLTHEGQDYEISTVENPLPMALYEQMQQEDGMILYYLDEKGSMLYAQEISPTSGYPQARP